MILNTTTDIYIKSLNYLHYKELGYDVKINKKNNH